MVAARVRSIVVATGKYFVRKAYFAILLFDDVVRLGFCGLICCCRGCILFTDESWLRWWFSLDYASA